MKSAGGRTAEDSSCLELVAAETVLRQCEMVHCPAEERFGQLAQGQLDVLERQLFAMSDLGCIFAGPLPRGDVGELVVVSRGFAFFGLMLFAEFDLGAILRRETESATPKITRFVVGNPLIMKEMAKAVPDAAAYAPITILVDERADGVHLSYDSMASLIAPYGSQAALAVARDLDAKIEGLLETAAR